jgi:hypothetical protein
MGIKKISLEKYIAPPVNVYRRSDVFLSLVSILGELPHQFLKPQLLQCLS